MSLSLLGQSSLKPAAELPIDSLALRILTGVTEEERMEANGLFLERISDSLRQPASYSLAFDELKSVSRLRSPDDAFRLWTWQLPRRGGRFHHQGILIFPGEERNRLIFLSDTTDEFRPEWRKPLKVEDWLGCIYYHIERVKTDGEVYYTLLGYDQHDLRTRRKFIDVLHIQEVDDRRMIRFGAPIFYTDIFQGETLDERPYRLLMQYSARFSAMLRWDEKEELIIMDHLSPKDAKMKGMYQFYGPDFTYDALEWSKKGWVLEEGVKPESDINAPIVPPDRGEGLPPRKP